MKINFWIFMFFSIIGIIFFVSLIIENNFNSNAILKPKLFKPTISSPVKTIAPKPIAPTIVCAREGQIPGSIGCCKDLSVIGGFCKKFSTKKLGFACAGLNQVLMAGQKCCEDFEPAGLVCKRRIPSGWLPSKSPIPSNPMYQCAGIDQTPTFAGCCQGLTEKNGKCDYAQDCARANQIASEHSNTCCADYAKNSQGICVYNRCGEIWQTASAYNGPNNGCCAGYAPDARGICKKMGCGVEGESGSQYARDCCRGLEQDSGICRPPCAGDNEQENSKPAGCCYMLIPDEDGICHPAQTGAPRPATPILPGGYSPW